MDRLRKDRWHWFICIMIFFIVYGCVSSSNVGTIKQKQPQFNIINFLGVFESIIVNDEPHNRKYPPQDLKNIKIIVQLDHNEISEFSGIRLYTPFNIYSLRRSPFLQVELKQKEGKFRSKLYFEWNKPSESDSAMAEGKINEALACLRMWEEGERCLLEYMEPQNIITSPDTVN